MKQQTFSNNYSPNSLFSLLARIEKNANIDLTKYPIILMILTEYQKDTFIIKGYIVDESFILKRKEKTLLISDTQYVVGK